MSGSDKIDESTLTDLQRAELTIERTKARLSMEQAKLPVTPTESTGAHEWLPDEALRCCSCGESCHTPTSLMAYAREECKKWHAAHVAALKPSEGQPPGTDWQDAVYQDMPAAVPSEGGTEPPAGLTGKKLQPTYYVQHPDNSYSVAEPQPSVLENPYESAQCSHSDRDNPNHVHTHACVESAPAPEGLEQQCSDIARSALYGAMGLLGISILEDEAVDAVADRLLPFVRAALAESEGRVAKAREDARMELLEELKEKFMANYDGCEAVPEGCVNGLIKDIERARALRESQASTTGESE